MGKFTILEPMSTGDVIDRAVRLYRRNFAPLVSIVAVPTVVGYLASLMFWYGYSNLVMGAQSPTGAPEGALPVLLLGLLCYPLWLFLLLVTVAGVTRVVGDNLMMGEVITFRKCLAAVRKRLGSITLLAFLSVGILVILYFFLAMLAFVMLLFVGIIVGLATAARLPTWAVVAVITITVVIALAAIILIISVIASRVVFLPQVVMIEGESPGSAIGRAIRLGKGNGHRVFAVAMFTYFVSLSLLSALTLPVLAGLELSGAISWDFWSSPGWSIVYASFRDIANLLALPIWIVSFTLLYFDNRVRKEAYDVELLVRDLGPGFTWQPAEFATVSVSIPAQSAPSRTYVQTSPLGLAGYMPPVSNEPEGEEPATAVTSLHCIQCGATLQPSARFCIRCGAQAVEPAGP